MSRSFLAALAVTCCALVATAARADVPYWQARNWFAPYARAIAVDPTDADIVYVGASSAATPLGEYTAGGSGVFRSTDGGATFTPRNTGIGNLLTTAIAIDPATPTTLYASVLDEGVFKSTNSGASWVPVNNGLTSLSVFSLAIDPTTPTTIYAGTASTTGGGVFRSLDGGASWTISSGTPGLTIFAIVIDPTTPTTVYAGARPGVRKSIDGGASFGASGTFVDATHPTEVRGLAIDASDPTRLLAAVYGWDSGMWRSTDAGASWQAQNTGLLTAFGGSKFVQHMTTVAQDPLDPDTFYASGLYGFFRSIDGGATWANFAAGLSRENCPAIATHAGGTVYTGSVFGELHRLQVRPSGVNHFRCFKAKATGFVPQPITLSDEFGTTTTTALKPVRYCTPTDPMGEGVVDPTSHLVCYKTAKYPFEEQWLPFLTQRIDGYRGYILERGDTVCVPATAGVPAAAPRDAYRCLDGPSWTSQAMDFTIADAYGSQLIRKHRTERFCTPTGIDGEARIEEDVTLRCDSMKGKATGFARTTVTTTDRFGTLTLRVVKPETHCFQALESRL
jgi:hypothetical protein